MKLSFWKSTAGIGVLCASGLLAAAAPLQRADVTANPAWLLHLDCDALRPTTLGKYILAEMEKPESQDKLAGFQTMFDLDLRTQLHGVTLYGNSPSPQDALLVIYADFDADHLTDLAKSATDSQSTTHGSTLIYNWIDDKKRAKNGVKPRVYAAIQGKRIIFGQREETVAKALDVLAGSAPNLSSGSAFPELGKSGSGHFVEAAARKMDLPNDNSPNAAIMKLAQSIQLVVGESRNQFKGALTFQTESDDDSAHVISIAQGLLSLAKLQTDKPEAVKFANAINFQQDGDRVTGSLSLPAADVVEMIKADAARKAARANKPAPSDP